MASPPPVFTVQSHIGQIGTEESVVQKKHCPIAVETGHCSQSILSHPLLYLHICPHVGLLHNMTHRPEVGQAEHD